jgi:hypothetical protein
LVDHVVGVITYHRAVVDLAEDLAGDMRRQWRRMLGLDADTSLVFVLVVLLFVIILLVIMVV